MVKEHSLPSSVCLGRVLGVAIVAGLIGSASVATLSLACDLPADPSPPTAHSYASSGGQVLAYLCAGQPNELFRREAYKAVVESVYEYDDVAWTACAATHAGGTFAAGTAVAPQMPAWR